MPGSRHHQLEPNKTEHNPSGCSKATSPVVSMSVVVGWAVLIALFVLFALAWADGWVATLDWTAGPGRSSQWWLSRAGIGFPSGPLPAAMGAVAATVGGPQTAGWLPAVVLVAASAGGGAAVAATSSGHTGRPVVVFVGATVAASAVFVVERLAAGQIGVAGGWVTLLWLWAALTQHRRDRAPSWVVGAALLATFAFSAQLGLMAFAVVCASVAAGHFAKPDRTSHKTMLLKVVKLTAWVAPVAAWTAAWWVWGGGDGQNSVNPGDFVATREHGGALLTWVVGGGFWRGPLPVGQWWWVAAALTATVGVAGIWWRRGSSEAKVVAAVWATAVICGAADHFGLMAPVVNVVPGAELFREPNKFAGLAAFAMVPATCWGVGGAMEAASNVSSKAVAAIAATATCLGLVLCVGTFGVLTSRPPVVELPSGLGAAEEQMQTGGGCGKVLAAPSNRWVATSWTNGRVVESPVSSLSECVRRDIDAYQLWAHGNIDALVADGWVGVLDAETIPGTVTYHQLN